MNTKVTIHYLTRCTRVDNLATIEQSIFNNVPDGLVVQWHIIFDSANLTEVPTNILEKYIGRHNIYFKDNNGYGMSVFNEFLSDMPSNDWFYILDDDNILHESFYSELGGLLLDGSYEGILVDQYIGGKDFTGLDYRVVDKNNIKVQKIDSAQFILKVSLWGHSKGFGEGYRADGEFIEELYKSRSEAFKIVNKTLSYYNYLQDSENQREAKSNSLVTSIIISDHLTQDLVKEFTRVNPILLPSDSTIGDILCTNTIDSIVTVSNSDPGFYSNLMSLPYDRRKSWVHVGLNTPIVELENVCFSSAMYDILDNDRPLVSVITPAYNTGDALLKTHNSLKEQTYDNWEWIIVNDSTDGKVTQKVIDSITSIDSRVKCFRLSENSEGNIGFVKYFGFSMSSGVMLVELDHDDYLFPFALSTLMQAKDKHTDCGFFYSDCIEYDPRTGRSLEYPDGWAFGYGSYYDFTHIDLSFRAASCPNINPKTIRHIVSSPNHVRAWTRDFYFSIGGHNKKLKIVDDYELIVRSFLNTRICKVAKPLYIQNIHGDNTTDYRRADIQNKVWFISDYYKDKIKDRFEELGFSDWAFEGNSANPLSVPSKFGVSENHVNYIYNC